MLIIDWVILAVVLISALISIKRGFVKEMLSLASWIAAFIIARIFSGHLDVLLVEWIETPSARYGAAFAILFAATLIVGAMINNLVGELVKVTGLAGTDRMFGIVFGVARGLILITAAVYGLQMTAFSADPWWKESALIPHFELMVSWSKNILPGAAETLLTLGKPSD
ncbi:MAG: membrane protein required for colicin V production [Bermanella sp.]|jgi:membrane protein required for colicin V production